MTDQWRRSFSGIYNSIITSQTPGIPLGILETFQGLLLSLLQRSLNVHEDKVGLLHFENITTCNCFHCHSLLPQRHLWAENTSSNDAKVQKSGNSRLATTSKQTLKKRTFVPVPPFPRGLPERQQENKAEPPGNKPPGTKSPGTEP